jgi:hypothetical protein
MAMTWPVPYTLLSLVLCCCGCATPNAIKKLSTAQLAAQQSYTSTLRNYFTVIESFVDAQTRVTNFEIDRIANEINASYVQAARNASPGTATDADRQKALDALVANVKENEASNAAAKAQIQSLVTLLKSKDADLLKAASTITEAQEKLNTYIQMKKADEELLNSLIQIVGINQQKAEQDASDIGSLLTQITKLAPQK